MALVKCKECKKEVSDKAKQCPHCGVKEPGVTAKQKAGGCLVALIIFAGIVYYFASSDSDNKTTNTNPVACAKNDGECIANFMMKNADLIVSCKTNIQKLSKYDYEWTDGIMTPMFSRYLLDEKNNQMTLVGDELKFTNGFNAKVPMTYHCIVNIDSETVANAKITQGRLQ